MDLIPGSGRSPGGGHGNPLQILPGESHGQRGLVGYSPWSCKESDTTEATEHEQDSLLCGDWPANSRLFSTSRLHPLGTDSTPPLVVTIKNVSQFSSVQLLSRVLLFETPWTAARQASLSITNSRSLLKLTSVESVMPSNHLILCRPLLLLPSIFPSIRVFSSESALHIR